MFDFQHLSWHVQYSTRGELQGNITAFILRLSQLQVQIGMGIGQCLLGRKDKARIRGRGQATAYAVRKRCFGLDSEAAERW